MMTIRVFNRTRGTLLGAHVRLADTMPSRVRGYLFRAAPGSGQGILLTPCKAVHMMGVRFPLDVVFISEDGRVVSVYPELKPWRRSRLHPGALHALELPAGTIRATGTEVGDDLTWADAAGGDPGAVGSRPGSSDVVPLTPLAGEEDGPGALERRRRA